MFLLLHITCSCIFIHMYFTFSIFLYIELFWDFSMAPKRKSTPSQNSLHFGASSSSDPTPSHVQFHDEKAKSDLFEKFSRRGIHSECQVILSDFSDTDLPTVIYSREWGTLCDVSVTCPSVPTCMDLIFQYLSLLLAFEVCA